MRRQAEALSTTEVTSNEMKIESSSRNTVYWTTVATYITYVKLNFLLLHV